MARRIPTTGPQFGPIILPLQGRDLLKRAPERPWDPDTFLVSSRGRESYSTIHFENQPVRVFSTPLRREGQVDAVIQVAFPLTDLYREVNRLTRTLLMLSPLALLIAALGGAFLTNRALRPVRQIAQAAEQIEAENLSGRLPVTGDGEFAELATTFNRMLGRLEEAFTRLEHAVEQQRRFTADASHELRTPLTIIKANTSLALRSRRTAERYRQALQAADRVADTTNRIVQDLLLLARADGGQLGLERDPTPLRAVLEAASEGIRAPGKPSVSIEIPEADLSVVGNAYELTRLFSNLIDNAVRHTPTDGQISIQACGDAGAVRVRVADTGEGIPPEHLPHVCDRFYRVDAARTRQRGGTGLGLAICQGIVEAHGGALAIHSTVGLGTTVTVRLPRAAAPSCEAWGSGSDGSLTSPPSPLPEAGRGSFSLPQPSWRAAPTPEHGGTAG
jgi:two-component system, OmpR family, sensor kinase